MLVLVGIVAFVLSSKLVLSMRAANRRRWRVYLVLPVLGLAMIALGAPRGLLLSKSLGLLLMPLGILWSALFAFTLAAFVHNRWRDGTTLAALWLVLTFATNAPISELLASFVEAEHAAVRPLSQGRFDAVIVLGGGTDGRPAGDVQLGSSGDRVALGARLYHTGQTPILVTSGSPIGGLRHHDSVAATTRIWRELAIPESAIVPVVGARTTAEEARLHANLIRARRWRRVGLVTSAAHMQRSLMRFEAEGVRVVPVPADVRAERPEWHGFYSVVPQGAAAQTIQSACWELVGRMAG